MYMLKTPLLFFALLSLAAAEHEPSDCLGDDKTLCESLASAVQQEDSPQGLEMLQLKGEKRKRKCPAPDLGKFRDGGKSCFQGEPPPGQDEACIGGNKEFQYMEEAWKACGENPFCGAVMQTPSGHFVLRRLSDPDQKGNDGSRLYTYNCQEDGQEQPSKQKEVQNELKNGAASKNQELKANSVMQESKTKESEEGAEEASEEEEESEENSEEDSEEAAEEDSEEEGEEEGEEGAEEEAQEEAEEGEESEEGAVDSEEESEEEGEEEAEREADDKAEEGEESEEEETENVEGAGEDLSLLQESSNDASDEESDAQYVEEAEEQDAEEQSEDDTEEEAEEESEGESEESEEQAEEESDEEAEEESEEEAEEASEEEEAEENSKEDEAEEEDKESQLHLLQMVREKQRAERMACPLPEKTGFKQGGKACPHPGQKDNGCLNENKGFNNLEDAWKACAEEEFCGAVMETWDHFFYIRRATDPDTDNEYQKTYMFPCKQQELQYKVVMAKAKAKAKALMKHVETLESEKKYEDIHDAQLMTKAEEEEVRIAADRHQREMMGEEQQAQERWKHLKMDYKKSEEKLAEQEQELAQAERMLKPVEQHASEYAGELEKSVQRLNDAGNYRAEYETKLKDLDEAKYQVEVASQVSADAKETLATAKKDMEEVSETEGKRLEEAQAEAKQATDEVKAFAKRQRQEKKELAEAQNELKEVDKAVAKQDARLKAAKTEVKKAIEEQAP